MPVQVIDGFTFRQAIVLPDGLIDTAFQGGTYLNLHTTDFPAGAVRGQISELVEGENTLVATLSGDNEVPPVELQAFAAAMIDLDPADPQNWSIRAWSFGVTLEDATGFHIHQGEAGTNGSVVVNLDPGGALRSGTDLAEAGYQYASFYLAEEGVDNTITGDSSVNWIGGDTGRDVLRGKGNHDVLTGEQGKDKLIGGNGRDFLQGGNGGDVLKGGNGADILHGGRGEDRIVTGNGKDVIAFEIPNLEREAGDFVTDFTAGQDSFLFVGDSSTAVKLDKVSTTDADASLRNQSNVVVLTDADGMTLDEATEFMAEVNGRTRDGLFAYFDSSVELAVLVYSEDLGDASAPVLPIVAFGEDADVLDGLKKSSFVLGTEADLLPY